MEVHLHHRWVLGDGTLKNNICTNAWRMHCSETSQTSSSGGTWRNLWEATCTAGGMITNRMVLPMGNGGVVEEMAAIRFEYVWHVNKWWLKQWHVTTKKGNHCGHAKFSALSSGEVAQFWGDFQATWCKLHVSSKQILELQCALRSQRRYELQRAKLWCAIVGDNPVNGLV